MKELNTSSNNTNLPAKFGQIVSLRFWGFNLLMAVVYYISGKLSFALSFEHSIVTIVIFTAEGFALAAALLLGKRILPGIFLGQFILALFNNLALLPTFLVSSINTLEAFIAITLYRHFNLNARLDNIHSLGSLVLIITLVLQPFSATFGTLSLALTGVLSWEYYLNSWFSWWFGNALGQLLVTPMILTFYATVKAHPSKKLWGEMAIVSAIFGFMAYFFTHYSPLSTFALMLAVTTPLVIMLAAYRGTFQACFSVFVMTAVILYETHQGYGLFKDHSFIHLIELNYYVLSNILLALVLGVLFKERKDSEEKLQLLALYDPLTGLLNRNVRTQELIRAIASAKRTSRKFAVGFLDLDGFKEINDEFGHATGDEVLKIVSQRLRNVTRKENTLIRQGGDEFILIIENMDLSEAFEPYLARLIRSVSQPMSIGENKIQVTCSIGVAVYPIDGEEPEELLKRADQAMYQAKKMGKNCFAYAQVA